MIVGDSKENEMKNNRCYCSNKQHKKRQKLSGPGEKGK